MARQPKDVQAAEQPDVEAWVWEAIASLNDTPGPTVHSENFSITWDTSIPGWLRAEGIQVDARGGTKQQAKRVCWEAMRRVLALAGTTHPDGVAGEVLVVSGPLWQPEPDGVPRYVVRVAIGAHPLSEPTGS